MNAQESASSGQPVSEGDRQAFSQLVSFMVLSMDEVKRFGSVDKAAIRAALEKSPGLCRETFPVRRESGGSRDLIPLSIVCCLDPSLDTVKAIYHLYPEAIRVEDSEKGTKVIDYACTFGASMEVINFLIEHNPSSLWTPRNDGTLTLHLAVFFKAQFEIIQHLIEACPQAVERYDEDKWSVLHHAANGQATLEVMKRLYELNSKDILTLDTKKRTPLHQACWKKGNLPVVKFLFEAAPEALHMEDSDRDTPLFRAARNQTLEVIQLLLPTNPPRDEVGATLLHYAAKDNTADVVRFLLERHPEMAVTPTLCTDRYTPLHSSCRFSDNLENIKLLVQYAPKALVMLTGDGHTPLDLALLYNESHEVVDYIRRVTARPEEKMYKPHDAISLVTNASFKENHHNMISFRENNNSSNNNDDDSFYGQ